MSHEKEQLNASNILDKLQRFAELQRDYWQQYSELIKELRAMNPIPIRRHVHGRQ